MSALAPGARPPAPLHAPCAPHALPRRAWLATALAALAAAGCASRPPIVGGERLTGRLSVRVDDAEARAFHGAFELDGTAEAGRLALNSPLGTRVAEAEWSPGTVRLRSGDGERRYPDLDSLAVDALGERLPLAALLDWLHGRPWAGAPSRPNETGFTQIDWRVDLSRRAEGWVEARRDAAPAVTVRARLDLP